MGAYAQGHYDIYISYPHWPGLIDSTRYFESEYDQQSYIADQPTAPLLKYIFRLNVFIN